MPFLWIETLNKDVNSPFKKRKKKHFAVYRLLIGLGIII